MKKYKKYSIVSFLVLTILFPTGTYIYLTKSAYWKIDKEARIEIISTMQSVESLPDKFYELYNKIYSNSLDKGQLYYLLNRGKGGYECPCRLAGYEISHVHNVHLVNIAFWLEDQVSQKECLNYYSTNVDLLYDVKGVSQGSIYYFNKSINDLSDSELIELIVMMENPSLYNKTRNADKLTERVNTILTKIKL